MSVWDFFRELWGSLVDALAPVFSANIGGFTIWQVSLIVFLFGVVVRFVLPLATMGSISGMGNLIKGRSDDVSDRKR